MKTVHDIVCSLVEFKQEVSIHKTYWPALSRSDNRECRYHSYKGIENIPTHQIDGKGFTTRLWDALKAEGYEVVGGSCNYEDSFDFYIATEPLGPLQHMTNGTYDGPVLSEFKTEQDFLAFKNAWEHGPTPQHRVDRAPQKYPCFYHYHMSKGVAYTSVSMIGVATEVPLNTLLMTYYYDMEMWPCPSIKSHN